MINLKTLFNHGVLGINARNLLYVGPFNPKKVTALADNKLKTKAFLSARGIPAARIYARIENRDQLRQFDFSKLPDECVLKPNYGFGGEGIIVFKGRDKQGRLLKQGKHPMDNQQIVKHIEDILEGKFSLGGRLDTAFFEQVLYPHSCFAKFRPDGLPDIRVIVFNLVPVMAMLRIPTAHSEGKANVHLGGIGIGIDIAKGVTTHAAQFHSMLKELPHGGSPSGIQIPYWDEILSICSRIQYITNIGYLAVDVTIDEDIGPAVLEVNARAGLMVQVANLIPLRARLERVSGVTVTTPDKGVRLCKELFGSAKIKREETKKDGKKILGSREVIQIVGDGATVEVPCGITPDKERTIFSPALIEKLKEKGALELEDEKEKTYRVKFTLSGVKLQTLIQEKEVKDADLHAMIGRRDLADFLIDPSKKSAPAKISSVKTDLRAVDNLLASIDKDFLLIKHLKPINLEEERKRLLEDRAYNPTFAYTEPTHDLDDVAKRLSTPIEDGSPLGILLEKKRKELALRVELLRTRGNAEVFTEASKQLFGEPSSALLRAASAGVHNRIACEIPPLNKKMRSAEEAKRKFMMVLEEYSLHNWQVSIRSRLVADCTVGGNHVYIREGALFSDEHIASLIAHEIETHVLTAENGEHQPYALLRRGTANYLDTQEGLAIYNQNQVLSPFNEKRFNPPRNILGLDFGLKHSFAKTRQYLQEELGYTPQKALSQAITIKRGLSDTSQKGGFTKSVVYFRGLRAIERFMEKGGDLRRLYIGKISIEDLDLIEKIPDLQQPLIIPTWLRE